MQQSDGHRDGIQSSTESSTLARPTGSFHRQCRYHGDTARPRRERLMNRSYHQSPGTFSARSTSLAELVTFKPCPCRFSLGRGISLFTIPTTTVAAKRGGKLVVKSKTATALFALGLDIRGEARGVRALSVHPGSIATELTRQVSLEDM